MKKSFIRRFYGYFFTPRKILRTMKLSTLFLVISTFSMLASPSLSQNMKVDLHVENATIKEVLLEIRKQTDISFLYNNEELNDSKRVTLNLNDNPIEDVLNLILRNQDLAYSIENNVILIYKPEKIPPATPLPQTDKKVITGTVTDELGEPVIGANIVEKGTTNGVITDIDGQFSLAVTNGVILHISYIGYISQEIPVNNQSNLIIKLVEDTRTLDEVIVIGYGTTTRRSTVGAVDQIGSSKIEDRPVGNITQALQGASPNLVIQTRSSNPNDNTLNLNIRGVNTFNDNSPLIVIDGLISDGDNFNQLNPNDIETISVLKDAGTAAIYGSRSSNGVIMITTKKGKLNSKPIVRFSAMVGFQDPHVLFSAVDGYQNADLRNQSLINVGDNAAFTPEQIRDLAAHRHEERFLLNELYRTALQQTYNVNISGGSETTTYMTSLGYYGQESNYIGPKTGIQRYNMRSNISTQIGPVKFTSGLSYARNNNNRPIASGQVEADGARLPSYYYYKMKSPNGKYLLNDIFTENNPVGMLESGGMRKDANNYITVNLSAEMKFLEDFTLKGIFGSDITAEHRFSRQQEVYFYANENDEEYFSRGNKNRETEDYNKNTYLINAQVLLDYNKTFGNHSVSGLIGVTQELYKSRYNEVRGQLTNPDLGTPTDDDSKVVIGQGVSLSNQSPTEWAIQSLLGRVNYSYADKYYIEGTFRYDGSSRFDGDKRWGFFPSVSGGWRLTEEVFMEKYREKLGDLKIRASYGILGNQSINMLDRFTVYNVKSNQYAFNNTSVSGTEFTLGNEDISWETTKTFNIGLDAGFFKNSLNITFDYFTQKTTDILLKPTIPGVFGTGAYMTNLGAMTNKGWDITVNYRFQTGEFKHNVSANIGDALNKVTKLESEIIGNSGVVQRITREGLPLSSYRGYKTDGLFQSYEEIENSAVPVGFYPEPGDLKFVDLNKDGVIDANDRFILGNAFPRYSYGITYNVSFKGFDFGIMGQGVGKREQALRGELVEPFHGNYSYNIYKHQLDFWTPTNTDARWPRLAAPNSQSNRNNFSNNSDIFLFDASYFRIKNIAIGYTLPKHISMKAKMQRCRIYVNGQNLFTFSNMSFVDPESSEYNNRMSPGSANSARNYPTLRYYGFGLDIEF